MTLINVLEKNIPVKNLFEKADDIVKPGIRKIVKERLDLCGGDAKRAAASLKKNPLYLDKEHTLLLEYASCYKQEYVIKYQLAALKRKDAEYIVDKHIREIVIARLNEHGDDTKKAFAEPLYADDAQKIQIKSVRCLTGLSSVVPVKKDDTGRDIGFVKPGNNHHIAIYKDADGKFRECVVTFWNAVERKKYGIPAVVKNPDAVWRDIDGKDISESLLGGLPNKDWTFVMSLQQNEMFVLGMEDDEFNDAVRENDYKTLAKHLYRVQKLAKHNYYFRYQYETQLDDRREAAKMKKFYCVQSFKALVVALHPRKVRINVLGELSVINEMP